MRFWEVLGIEPTDKISDIKKAYAKNLRLHHPEDDPEGFQNLREAYTAAINYVKRSQKDNATNDIEEETYDTNLHDVNFHNEAKQDIKLHNVDFNDDIGVASKRISLHNFKDYEDLSSNEDNFNNSVDKFISNVEKLYDDFYSRIDIEKWKEILNSDAIWYMGDKTYLNDKFIGFLKTKYYMPRKVWKLIDDTFELTNNRDYFYKRYSKEVMQYLYIAIDGPFEFSFEHFENVENIDIDEYFDFRESGYYEFMDGNLEKAGQEFFKAYNIYKNDPSLLKMIGEYYFAIKDFDNALKYLKNVFDITPEDESAAFLKAKILYEKDDVKASLDILKELNKKSPEDEAVLSFLGRSYFKLNDIENSQKVFLKIIKKNPLDIQAKAVLMRIVYKKKKDVKGKLEKSKLIKLCEEAGISQKNLKKHIKPNIKALLFIFLFFVICAFISMKSMMKDADINISAENMIKFIQHKRTPVVINNYGELMKLKLGENVVELKLKDVQFVGVWGARKKYGNKEVKFYETIKDSDAPKRSLEILDTAVCMGKLGNKNVIIIMDADDCPAPGKGISLDYSGTVYKNKSSGLTEKIKESLREGPVETIYNNQNINTNIYVGPKAKLKKPSNFKTLIFGASVVLGLWVLASCLVEILNSITSFRRGRHEYTPRNR